MNIYFKEIYYDDGTATILLELEEYYNNELITKIPYSFKNNDFYIINLEYQCFENDTINNLINAILNKYNMTYIDKDLWNKYLDDTEREKRENLISYNVVEKPKYDTAWDLKKKELISYKFNFNNNYNQLYIDSNTLNNCIKIITFKDRISNENDFAITLLNFIFNSNFNLKISTCKNCNKPFLTNTLNLINCKRIFKDNITCNQYANKVRKQYQYDDPIKHLIKNVRDKLKGNYDELDKFNQLLPLKKEEFLNDNKSIILWLLNTYYTEQGKEKAIERLKLTKYL